MNRLMSMAVVAALSGCGVGVDEGEVSNTLGSTREAIASMGYASWGTPGNTGSPLDLGPDTDRTCFLQGVTGELQGAQYGTPASVRVFQNAGRWWLQTKAGNGSGVMGHATCIPTTNRRQYLSWSGNTGSGTAYSVNKRWLPQDAVTGITECFLTEVSATVGFSSPDSFVTLNKERIWWGGVGFDTWTLSGNMMRQQDNSAGGHAKAVCVDLWNTIDDYSWQSASGSSGITSAAIAPTSTHTCSITKLVGNFASNPQGWNDGVKLFIENGNWKVFSSTGKRIEGSCYGYITF